MAKNYEQPRLVILAIEYQDVITTSSFTDGEGNGGIYNPEPPFSN